MRDSELDREQQFELENQSEPFFGQAEGAYEGEAFGEGPVGEYDFEGEGAFGESLGEGMFEAENEQFSLESELGGFGESEEEQFFGSAFKGIANLVKRAAPMLKNVAKMAAPMIGTAIGGPLGAKVGSMAANLLGESEFDYESAFEAEGESEAEMEAVMEGPLTEQQALGELMAAAASRAATDYEAEAQIGSATAIVLSRADLAALRSVLPDINRGIAVLTRVLRRRGDTRHAVRTIPVIVKRSAVALRNQAASGRPVTRKSAARAVATQTQRVLGSPSTCAKAIQRNVKATKAAARASRPRQQSPRYAI